MRRKPYTAIGIKRVPCTRCGRPSSASWKVCADGQYRGLCTRCDILLNDMVLKLMRIKDAKAKMQKYVERKEV